MSLNRGRMFTDSLYEFVATIPCAGRNAAKEDRQVPSCRGQHAKRDFSFTTPGMNLSPTIKSHSQ